MDYLNKILLGDCLEVLQKLPDESLDSCISDVPYGLGLKEPTVEEIIAYLQGEELNCGGDFMGKAWNVPSVKVWKEVFRVLKPGAHVLAFAGTRTWDLISLGLRAAGFEDRDTIASNHPALMWTYASGMPKSVDVQYAVSQKAGICLSPEVAPHVVLPSKLCPVLSEEGTALIAVGFAQIQPEGVPVLLTGLGKGGVSSVRMVISLSELSEGMNSNTDSSSPSIWEDLLGPMKTSITETEIVQIIGLKTWNLLVEQTISANTTLRKKIRLNGCKCPALPVVCLSKGELTSKQDIPVLSAHDGTTSTEVVHNLSGFGCNLKPSWEPILVFRKPFKGTLADNVLEHGTGGLNIDATRVKHSSPEDFENHKKQVEAVKAKGGQRGDSWKNSSDLSGANDVKAGGRWPANTVFTHSPGCEQMGTKKVKLNGSGIATETSQTNVKPTGGLTYGEMDRLDRTSGYASEPGKEVINHWQCIPGCPVAELDAQSGDRPSTLTGRADPNQSHTHPGTEFNPNSTFLGERTHHSAVYADSGGASRFFQQFEGAPFTFMPKANRKEAGGGEFKVVHPTLKPYKLMQYLIKLVTPKGGTVLDPYCGSGTTCHAALLERVNFVGIERDGDSWAEANLRIKVIQNQVAEDYHAEALEDEINAFDDDPLA